MHKRSSELTGGRISYSYILAGMDGEEQLGMGFLNPITVRAELVCILICNISIAQN